MAFAAAGRLYLTEFESNGGSGCCYGGFVGWLDRPHEATNATGELPLGGWVANGPPAGPDRLSPRALAVDPTSGKVFVTDAPNARVLRFASAAALARGERPESVLGQPDFEQSGMRATRAGMYYPIGLAVDAEGRLYVADHGFSRVLRFDAAASLPPGAPADAVFGQSSFIPDRTKSPSTSPEPEMHVAVGPTGALFVSRLWEGVFRYDGATTATVMPTASATVEVSSAPRSDPERHISMPNAIDVDGAGRLYVSDFRSSDIYRFDDVSSGTVAPPARGFFTADGPSSLSGSQAAGLAFDGSDRLYVADRGLHRVVGLEVLSGGVPLEGDAPIAVVIGQPDPTSSGPGTSASRLNGPTDVAVANGGRTLLVADAGNHRVLVFGDLTVDAERPAVPAAGVQVSVRGRRVHVALRAAEAVRVEVFDVLGRRVATLHDGPADALSLELPASLASGVYVVRARTNAAQATAPAVVR